MIIAKRKWAKVELKLHFFRKLRYLMKLRGFLIPGAVPFLQGAEIHGDR
jgi:hypothetical protein